MTTLELTGPGMPQPTRIPSEFAELMWPEVPSLVEEVIAEIRRTIRVYAREPDSAYDQILRLGAQQLFTAFIEEVAEPSTSTEERNATARALGHFEALEGRGLDSVTSAYRLAFHLAWRRVASVAERVRLSSNVLALMVDNMIVYMEQVTDQTRAGHESALKLADEGHQKTRARLLRLILQQPPASAEAIAELAAQAGWALPAEVSVVAVGPGAACTMTALDPDVLSSGGDGEPLILLIPGAPDKGRLVMLTAALGDTRSAVGLTVPPAQAADSLRWALRILELAADGVIPDGPLIRCADHLMTVFLLSDTALVEQLAKRHLAPLAEVSARQRHRLTETLREWVATRGTAAEIGARLHIHPQTVRYRIRQLDEYLGEALTDPDTRFCVEVTLRATHLARRHGR